MLSYRCFALFRGPLECSLASVFRSSGSDEVDIGTGRDQRVDSLRPHKEAMGAAVRVNRNTPRAKQWALGRAGHWPAAVQ